MRALNPRLIYCSVSGYGQSGPRRDWTAIDNIVQATSGMMSLGGAPDAPPARVGFPVVDTLTGQTAAFAIVSALLARERGGGGDYIDVAMFDASLAFMASAVVPWLVTGRALERTGNTGYSGQPTSALFEARDGRRISLGVVQQHQFVALAKVLGREDWLREPAFADPETRRANSSAVHAALAALFRERDALEWESLLSAAGIPCGMVREIGEAASLPALEQRQLLLPLEVPGLPTRERVHVLGAGFLSERGIDTDPGPPPRPGQHREEILRWLGN
jgi:crotonobetainyl-CoA:carnitine CoA-transferase CaiB-like acyl-CoA transferase